MSLPLALFVATVVAILVLLAVAFLREAIRGA
jgi:hypothetical protein